MLSFKTWMENSDALKVALVGWDGSQADRSFFSQAGKYLKGDRHIGRLWPHARKDVIDLNDGRDFLQEARPYDVVLLCWVHAGDAHKGSQGRYNVSKKHSPKDWKDRLVGSGAKYIFVSGAGTEVAAEYLGQLAGYLKKPIDPHTAVYIHRNLYR